MAITEPTYNPMPFASNGDKNTIPVAPAAGGAASMTSGFPAITMQPIASGGIPPSGKDMNGILYQLSQHQVWLNAGGMYKFNAAFATTIGGYPKGAVLQTDDELSAYISTMDGNQHNLNSDTTGWRAYGGKVMEDKVTNVVDLIYPVGVIIDFGVTSFNPNTQYPGTEWIRHGEGRASVGLSTSSNDPQWTKNVGNIYGEYQITISEAQMPRHVHRVACDNGGSNPPMPPVNAPDNTHAGFNPNQYDLSSVQAAPTFTTVLGQDSSSTVSDNYTVEPLDWAAAGGSQPISVIQPSIVDARWRRIA